MSPPPHLRRFTEQSDQEGSNFEDSHSDFESMVVSPSPTGMRLRKNFDSASQKKIQLQVANGYPAESTLPSENSTLFCSHESHLDPSAPYPSTPITHCAILRKLRMRFGPYGFVCEKCGQLYPPKYLATHIERNNVEDLDLPTGRRKREACGPVVAHILASHGASKTTTFELPPVILDAIPGLTPTLCSKCPVCPTP
ncbi:hypothetical protein OG21DRAFT_1518563 [Imleria badia]|jgi:hypothetical protein|nr:hypothetical protein OG21DRAFT_1518563 [Imleria badia]